MCYFVSMNVLFAMRFCDFVLQKAIEYLLPSGLFDRKARPQMKVSV